MCKIWANFGKFYVKNVLKRSFIKRQTSGTPSDNECQRVATSSKTSDNKWQGVVKRVTTGDNKWQRMTASDSEWKRVTKNDNEWYNERQRVAQRLKANGSKSDFRFQKESIMQCISAIYLAMSFWKYNVKQNICRNSHQRCSIEKATLRTFAIFTEKQLKACYSVKKRIQKTVFLWILRNF